MLFNFLVKDKENSLEVMEVVCGFVVLGIVVMNYEIVEEVVNMVKEL